MSRCVYLEEGRNRYRARVVIEGIKYSLGRYKTDEEASIVVESFIKSKREEILNRKESISEEGEEWRDVVGYEGKYKISSYGRVKSYNKSTDLLKQFKDRNGYYRVTFHIGIKPVANFPHLLVAAAFLGHFSNKDRSITVDHIDGDKLNNRLDNLQIISNRCNTIKGLKNKLGFPLLRQQRGKFYGSLSSGGKNINTERFETTQEAAESVIKLFEEKIPGDAHSINYLKDLFLKTYK